MNWSALRRYTMGSMEFRTRVRLAQLALGMTLTGCATYTPRPLTPEAVDRALASPPEAEVNAQAAAVASAWPTPTQWTPGPLDADRAAVLAVVLNPSLRAERARRDLAQAQLVQAGILPNPQVSFGLIPPIGMNSSGEVVGWDLGLSWEVTSLIAHGALVDSARAAVDQVRLDVAWREWQVAEEARVAAIDLGAFEASLSLRQEMDERFAQRLAEVRKAVDRGDGVLPELAVAEAASQRAHMDLLAAQADADTQRLTLKRALGLPPDAPIDVVSRPPASVSLPDRATLAAAMDTRRLDLVALRAGYRSQEERLRAAVLQQFPRISIGPTGSKDTGDFYTLGFGVTIDLPVFDQNQGQIAIEHATRDQLFDEYTARVFEARADLAQALDTIDGLRPQIAAAMAALPSLETLATTYRAALAQSKIDPLTAYEAENALIQQRVDLLELERQLGRQVVALELASGVFVPLERPPEAAPVGAAGVGGPTQ